jgi:hypothetical protein
MNMPVVVAEYLGVRTDRGIQITPIPISKNGGSNLKPNNLQCPFKNSHCEKASRGDKPVCSVRDLHSKELWIVCPSRLCATMKGSKKTPISLNEHQKQVLHEVAIEVFGRNIPRNEVLVDREVKIPVTESSDYSADYVMWCKNPQHSSIGNQDRPFVLEMQGGGETTATGDLTKLITKWENSEAKLQDAAQLTSPLITNAWRRQQEQFLVKGNTAMLTGGRIVFCIGTMIYDYLMPRLTTTTKFPNLKNANWSLALLSIKEDTSTNPAPRPSCAPDSLPLIIDKQKTLFTNYGFFVQAITNQGSPCAEIFERDYIDLA